MLSLIRAALVFTLFAAAATHAAPPRDLDRYAQRALETFEAPGMTIVIVERGKPSIVRSYGVRRLGESAKVDAHTLFGIGSTTKAFTSALLAMLVDDGKLTWDTKVVDVLPGFRMYDAYASAEMTVRDLLTHRSGLGLGAGDLMFYPPTTFSREEILHKLRFIKPATSFRSGYAYDNVLYLVAGEVIEAVTGDTWENVLSKRILAPLGMNTTTTQMALTDAANKAWPHARTSGEFRGVGALSAMPRVMAFDNVAPAGALHSSGDEIARWLELQLGSGLDPRTNMRFFSEAQAREMWTAQTLIPIAQNPEPLTLAQAKFRAYSLGWNVSDYRGERIVSHGGGVPGSVTSFVIAPDRDVAIALMTNSEEGSALVSVQYRLLDHYLSVQSPDWIAAFKEVREARVKQAQDTMAKLSVDAPAQGAKGPSLELDRYAGRYRDDWYGFATIERGTDGLTMRFEHTPSLSGKLEHVRNDTFRTRWTDRAFEDAYVTFALKPDGAIERMTMKAISPLADFSFDFHDLLFRPAP